MFTYCSLYLCINLLESASDSDSEHETNKNTPAANNVKGYPIIKSYIYNHSTPIIVFILNICYSVFISVYRMGIGAIAKPKGSERVYDYIYIIRIIVYFMLFLYIHICVDRSVGPEVEKETSLAAEQRGFSSTGIKSGSQNSFETTTIRCKHINRYIST